MILPSETNSDPKPLLQQQGGVEKQHHHTLVRPKKTPAKKTTKKAPKIGKLVRFRLKLAALQRAETAEQMNTLEKVAARAMVEACEDGLRKMAASIIQKAWFKHQKPTKARSRARSEDQDHLIIGIGSPKKKTKTIADPELLQDPASSEPVRRNSQRATQEAGARNQGDSSGASNQGQGAGDKENIQRLLSAAEELAPSPLRWEVGVQPSPAPVHYTDRPLTALNSRQDHHPTPYPTPSSQQVGPSSHTSSQQDQHPTPHPTPHSTL